MFFQGKSPANQSCKWTWQRTNTILVMKFKLQAEVVAPVSHCATSSPVVKGAQEADPSFS